MSQPSTVQWRDSRCTRFRYRYSECSRCAEACPHAAVELHDAGIRIAADRCRHCALCVDACHTGALQDPAYQPIAMLREAIARPAWRVACAPSGEAGDTVLPCLGALGPVTMTYLARRGIALSLRGSGHCGDCEHGPKGAERLDASLQAVQQMHDAVRRDPDPAWVMPTRSLPAAAVAPQARPAKAGTTTDAAVAAARRRWLRHLIPRMHDDPALESATAGTDGPAPRAIRAGPYFVPEQRELLSIICHRTEGVPVQVPLDDAWSLLQLHLKSGCTVCEACFRVCPTGALAIDETPFEWALTFDLERCVGCQVCLEVCQPRVLDARAVAEMRHEAPAEALLSLRKQRCARCDRFFVSARPEQHCRICSDDQDAFSAIFG